MTVNFMESTESRVIDSISICSKNIPVPDKLTLYDLFNSFISIINLIGTLKNNADILFQFLYFRFSLSS